MGVAKAQVSAEMLIVLAILLAVAFILATQLLKSGKNVSGDIDAKVDMTICITTSCTADRDCYDACGSGSSCDGGTCKPA